jgi:DNA-binding transcriptional MerR regulator
MKIGELSRRSGVSVPTIKYYLREKLLPAGTPTATNQADYTEEHLRRLRLIRALVEVGGLSVAATADVLATLDDPEIPEHQRLGGAHWAITPAARGSREGERWTRARSQAGELVREWGWQVGDEAPALDLLADGLAALDAIGHTDFVAVLDDYARVAQDLAEVDLEIVGQIGANRPEALLEAVVVGTVLGEALFNAVRRLAQENASAKRYPG